MSDDEAFWLITLGVHDPDAVLFNQAMKAAAPWFARPSSKLKVFQVDAASGRVKSMKIR